MCDDVQTENTPHVVVIDYMTKDVHVFPKQFLTEVSNGTANLRHLSRREQEEIIRCFATAALGYFCLELGNEANRQG